MVQPRITLQESDSQRLDAGREKHLRPVCTLAIDHLCRTSRNCAVWGETGESVTLPLPRAKL